MRFPVGIFRARDRSMEPSILPGDFLIVSRSSKRLRVGDMVVLRHPTMSMHIVKRISAISNSKVFVTGDNKAESEDSRKFGSVGQRSIIGKIVFKI